MKTIISRLIALLALGSSMLYFPTAGATASEIETLDYQACLTLWLTPQELQPQKVAKQKTWTSVQDLMKQPLSHLL